MPLGKLHQPESSQPALRGVTSRVCLTPSHSRALAMKEFAACIVLLLVGTALAQDTVSLTRPQGAAVQQVAEPLLREIYRRAGLKLTVTSRPNLRTILEINAGNFDGEVARIYSYGERHPTLVRVEPAFYQLNTATYARAGSIVSIKSKEDLKKYRVGIARGVQHAADATAGLESVEVAPDSITLFLMLKAGRFDLAVDSEVNGLYAMGKLGIRDIDKRTVLSRQDLYHYLHERNKDLAPVLGAVIEKMVKSGELNKLGLAAETAFSKSGAEP